MRSSKHDLFIPLLSIICLLLSSCQKEEVIESPPQALDAGSGPVALLSLNVQEKEKAAEEENESIIYVTTDVEGFEVFVQSPDLQLRVFLDTPESQSIVFFSAGRAMLVSPDFKLLVPELVTRQSPEASTLEIIVPMGTEGLDGLASLGWNTTPDSLHATVLPGLQYFGFEIGRKHFGINGMMSEIFFKLTTAQEFKLARKKKWHADKKVIKRYLKTETDTTNPSGNPGPMYKHFPLEFEGNVLFFEYWHASGFVKRFLIDSNGNGKRDTGEVDGYVGRCSYSPGTNAQTLWKDGSTTWTTELDNLGGQRIRHVLKKRRKPDGTDEWVVESTHEEQKPGNKGKWTKTKVPKGKSNPIVNPPYEKPSDVPGNSSFGLPPPKPFSWLDY